MIPGKLAITGFIILCAIQLYIAGGMIIANETLLVEGKIIKLRTAPLDPNDPFRGKYIILNLLDNLVEVSEAGDWTYGDVAYVTFREDAQGFALTDQLSKSEPAGTQDYLKVKVTGIIDRPEEQKVYIAFPFDRFYMEEKKAPEAERIYREALSDTSKVTYAQVHLKNGSGVLSDVFIGDRSLVQLIKDQ
jgi:uncharacterized membrane-anchored protein